MISFFSALCAHAVPAAGASLAVQNKGLSITRRHNCAGDAWRRRRGLFGFQEESPYNNVSTG